MLRVVYVTLFLLAPLFPPFDDRELIAVARLTVGFGTGGGGGAGAGAGAGAAFGTGLSGRAASFFFCCFGGCFVLGLVGLSVFFFAAAASPAFAALPAVGCMPYGAGCLSCTGGCCLLFRCRCPPDDAGFSAGFLCAGFLCSPRSRTSSLRSCLRASSLASSKASSRALAAAAAAAALLWPGKSRPAAAAANAAAAALVGAR